jgi:membrane dipeptidase
MKFIDMHCDTLEKLMLSREAGRDLGANAHTHVDLDRMEQGGEMAQFFACFMPTADGYQHFQVPIMKDWAYIDACHAVLMENLKRYPDRIALAHTAEEIEANDQKGLMSAVFTMEDGRAVDGKLENLRKLHDDYDVRVLCLTWNSYNCFGAPNSFDPLIQHDGLTAFGRSAVRYMQEIGILVDVSHLSEGGFWDVCAAAEKPFVATHSNCKALSPHPRNLTDEQLKALGDHGGVAGLNFCPAFLNEDVLSHETASTAALLAEHARHMADAAGVETVALGSDLDGMGGHVEIDSIEKYGLLEEALRKEGFHNDEIEKIFYRNVLRVMHDAVK